MRQHALRLFSLLIILLSAVIIPSAETQAQDQPAVTMTVGAGFDGKCKQGLWIPLRVVIENNGSDL